MFISPAYAQAFGSFGDSTNTLVQFAPFVLIFVVFYFFLIRPQQQKAKEHRNMLTALRRGDRVVTGGGIVGTVAKVVGDDEVLVDIADNTRVRVVRSTITSVLAKTEPVAAKADKDDADKQDADAEKGKGSARRAAGGK
ncbi:MAG TPA: preprotein translocase subunit YajC [Stellaceae bacterium]